MVELVSLDNQTESTLTVRFSDCRDVDPIARFYFDNDHPHVNKIKENELTSWTEAGRFLLFTTGDENVVIASAAKLHSHFNIESRSMRTWTEIGASRSTLDKGFSLYPFIVSAQAFQELFERAPSEQLFIKVKNHNPKVADIVRQKIGWQEDIPSAELLQVTNRTFSSNHSTWFLPTAEALSENAGIILDRIENPVIENVKTGSRIHLDFSRFALAQEPQQSRLSAICHNRDEESFSCIPPSIQPAAA